MAAMERLSPRKEAILRAIVEEYIRTAKPVGSEYLARRYRLGISPATVRNEMGDLEDLQLIYQQHTSAGRMPTDLGYRYFVERLMDESALSPDEQRLIRHQFYQVQHQLDQWVRLTAAVLAQALQSAAIVTPPQAQQGRLRHFELLSLHDTVALLVLVLQDSAVKQERLFLEEPLSQEQLSQLARRFNAWFHDATAAEVRRHPGLATVMSENERIIVSALIRILERYGGFNADASYHEGILNMLNQKEYREMGTETERNERIRKVVEVLEQNRLLPAIAPQVLAADGVQVIIGGEHQWDQMKDLSMVVARYGVEGRATGLLGVVGPTRMQYSRAIAMVRYLSDLMNDLLAEMYGD
jgi:heat-inducible transcriptional repressor